MHWTFTERELEQLRDDLEAVRGHMQAQGLNTRRQDDCLKETLYRLWRIQHERGSEVELCLRPTQREGEA